jgi:hypothetical protein
MEIPHPNALCHWDLYSQQLEQACAASAQRMEHQADYIKCMNIRGVVYYSFLARRKITFPNSRHFFRGATRHAALDDGSI